MDVTVCGADDGKTTYVGLEGKNFSAYAAVHLERRKLLRAAEAAVGIALLLRGKSRRAGRGAAGYACAKQTPRKPNAAAGRKA